MTMQAFARQVVIPRGSRPFNVARHNILLPRASTSQTSYQFHNFSSSTKLQIFRVFLKGWKAYHGEEPPEKFKGVADDLRRKWYTREGAKRKASKITGSTVKNSGSTKPQGFGNAVEGDRAHAYNHPEIREMIKEHADRLVPNGHTRERAEILARKELHKTAKKAFYRFVVKKILGLSCGLAWTYVILSWLFSKGGDSMEVSITDKSAGTQK